MTKISYNIEDKGWKKHFPHFKKYIGKAVNETLKQMDIKIDEDIVVSIFLTSNKEIKNLIINIEIKINQQMFYHFQCNLLQMVFTF